MRMATSSDGRQIWEYPKERYAFRSESQKWGVQKRRGKPIEKELLILGTGRSGSMFISNLFKYWGYDIPHERTGEHGTSSHFYHADHHWYPMFPWTDYKTTHVGERLSDFNFKHRLHVARHPLKCITSIYKKFWTLDWEFAEETGILPVEDMSRLRRSMLYWYNLNRKEQVMCEYTILLENLEEELPYYLNKIGMDFGDWPTKRIGKNKSSGYDKRKPFTLKELEEVDLELATKIKAYAITGLGYEI
jgi:hypothetical protein